MTSVLLPTGERYQLREPPTLPPPVPFRTRVAYAAAHVVADPFADNVPGAPAALDWDATLAFRHHLWRHGFGVAEAMDTAQRGMGLDYPATRELIRRSAPRPRGGRRSWPASEPISCRRDRPHWIDIAAAYEQQLSDVEEAGATPVLMCSRQLAAAARDADDYLKVYSGLIGQASGPVLLHWLGEMFDPLSSGYWGSPDLDIATETVLALVREHPDRVDGIKVSLLDEAREVALRRRLPAGVRLYTGDDFHYPQLIRGDEAGHSDALLGIFAAIAVPAAAALVALDAGDLAPFDQLPGRRRFRWRGTSSPRRPPRTRPGSSSWPGWPGTRTTSRWSAACSPTGRPSTWPPCWCWPTGRRAARPRPGRRPGPVRTSRWRWASDDPLLQPGHRPELAGARPDRRVRRGRPDPGRALA